MKKILFSFFIVLFYSGLIYAQGLGTLRDNTKVRTSDFQDTTTYVQAQLDTVINSTRTPRIPTVYVCASNSPQELKAIAKYVCDGTEDAVEINAAMQYCAGLPSKGHVQLEGGTFILNEAIGDNSIYLSSNVTISGRGTATILDISQDGTGQAPIVANGVINAVLENLVVDGDYQTTQYYAKLTNTDNVTIRNCRFINPTAFGAGTILISNSSNTIISENYVETKTFDSISATNIYNAHILNNEITATSYGGADMGIRIGYTSAMIKHELHIIGNNIKNMNRGILVSANNSIISNNICNNNFNYGFSISGSSNVIEGNSAYENGTVNALISATRSKDEGNSWNSDQLNIDGSNAMTANLNMGNNNINNCPVIMTSTSDVAGLKISTAGLQSQVDVIVSTNLAQWNLGYANQTNITNNYNVLEATATDLYTKSATNATNITNNYNTLESTATDLYTKSANNTSAITSTWTALVAVDNDLYNWVYFSTSGFIVLFSTPIVNDPYYSIMPSTLTLTSILASVMVAPTGANLTIGVSTVTSMTASYGTLTITAGQTQSNTLSAYIAIPRDSPLIFTPTGIGSTVAGFSGAIKVRYYKDKRGGN